MRTIDSVPASDRPVCEQRSARTRNLLLQNLADDDFALLSPDLERVPFTVGEALATAGNPIESVCFPEGAIAGVLDSLDGDRRFAIGLIGHEGFIGSPLLLGDDRWPYDFVMRAERGDALRMPAGAFRAAVEASPTLRGMLLRFAHAFMMQMGRTIVSSLAHPIERRMARWILLYHDRVQADEISMTHEEFGLMLGVRRSSVTDALHRLEEEKAIRAVRGKVVVRDRVRLLDLAGDTYGEAERTYCRLIIGNCDHSNIP